MLPKILETEPYLTSSRGTIEKTVTLLTEDSIRSDNFIKVASEALDYCKSIKSTPGKTKILVLAMGASEYYGPNRNGDAFREEELIKHHKTFKTNSHVFRSHVNKDPAKAIGKVLESFYNRDMHRVELILELDDEKAADEVKKIRANKDVAVSMGCRIKYDVCSICGNKAPTRAQYCKHLKYEMGDIYPDGRVVCADNPKPNFFDISIVFRPADKTGYMLKKVAKHGSGVLKGNLSTDLAIKTSTLTVLSSYLRKAADIDKTISGVAVGVDTEDIPTEDLSNSEKSLSKKWISTLTPNIVAAYTSIGSDSLSSLSKGSFSESLKILGKHGVFLMTPEFMELLFRKLLGKSAPKGLASKLVSLQKDIFNVLAKHPEIPSSAFEEGIIDTFDSSSDISSLDKEARQRLGGSVKTSSFVEEEVYSMCKVAGYAAILYSAYCASILEASDTENKTEKLASFANVSLDTNTIGNHYYNKLNYLEHRTMDMFKNHGPFSKLSSVSTIGDINLFIDNPEKYYYNLGKDILFS